MKPLAEFLKPWKGLHWFVLKIALVWLVGGTLFYGAHVLLEVKP